jgi:GNAT superfamily N-acetyltransferase
MTRATEFRPATATDAEEIADIARVIGGDNTALPRELSDPAGVRAWLDRLGHNGLVMIAFDGSIPIAFGAIDYSTTEPDTALIGVWVLPDYRRRGLATRVAEDLIDFAREKGYRRVRGRLPEGNEPALSFLSAIGAMVPLRNPDMTFELPL